MNKIITEQIGEYVIITGAAKLSIDNEGTKVGTQAKIEALPEFVEMLAAQRAKSQALQAMGKARGRCGAFLKMEFDALKAKDEAKDEKTKAKFDIDAKKAKSEADKQDKEYNDQLGVVGAKNTELIEITGRYNPKQMQIKRDNPSFNQPNIGEYIDRGLVVVGCDESGNPGFLEEIEMIDFLIPENLTVAGLMELYLARGDNQQLLLSGEYIEDFRGCQYFYQVDGSDNWVPSEIITELGVDRDTIVVDGYQDQAIEFNDLSDIQKEQWRMQSLSPEDKAAEYNGNVIALANQAQSTENQLKFSGDIDYQTKAQTFYDEQLVILNTKYGVV